MEAFGDLARSLVMRSSQLRLRDQVDQLATELTTGTVADPARHLAGDTTLLNTLDRSLAQLNAYETATSEVQLIASSMQTALGGIQEQTEQLSQSLITADLNPSDTTLNSFSDNARQTLGNVLDKLNTSIGGRFLFSGIRSDQPAVNGIDDMMDALRTQLTGTTDLASINAALDGFFAPGGAFETVIYSGSDIGLAPVGLSQNESVSIDVRADGDALRGLLRPLALAAIAGDEVLAFDMGIKQDMLTSASLGMIDEMQSFVGLRADVGSVEARIADSATRNASERSAINLAKLELIEADPFETATRYESARSQLETLYAVTARSQRLSLVDFL